MRWSGCIPNHNARRVGATRRSNSSNNRSARSPNARNAFASDSAHVFPCAVTHATRRRDFKRAGITPENDDGHADLHSLRHTFGTRLAAAGVPPAKLQRLMRHATVELTMRYYVHLDVESLDSGLSVLPGIEDEGPEAAAG